MGGCCVTITEGGKTFGRYLKELRDRKGDSLKVVGRAVGVSSMYLSEIERNPKKIPSDEIIRSLADYYNISEILLYEYAGKMPLATREQLEELPWLQKSLARVKLENIPDDEKDELFDEIQRVFSRYLKEESD